jgi:cyanophycinase-like exopeptidase
LLWCCWAVTARWTRPQHFYASIHSACPGNSVVTLVITSREGANDPFVAEKTRKAHAIFIAGGDQSNYLKYRPDNALQKEIDRADVIAWQTG